MVHERPPRERILQAIWTADQAFIIPTLDPLRFEDVWITVDGERIKAVVIWCPPAMGQPLHQDGLIQPVEMTTDDRTALRTAMRGYAIFPQVQRAFRCKLTRLGLAEVVL